MLPSGITPSPNAFHGKKVAEGLYIFPNAYEGEYDYFAPIAQDKIPKEKAKMVPSTNKIHDHCPCCGAESRNISTGDMVACYGCNTELLALAWLPGRYLIKQSDKCRIWELEEYVAQLESLANAVATARDLGHSSAHGWNAMIDALDALTKYRKRKDDTDPENAPVAP